MLAFERFAWLAPAIAGLIVACGGQSERRGTGAQPSAGAAGNGSSGGLSSSGGAGGRTDAKGGSAQGGEESPSTAGAGYGGAAEAGAGATAGAASGHGGAAAGAASGHGGATSGHGGAADGGTEAGGSSGSGGTAGGAGGSAVSHRPCDIYRDAGQPCVAAYSTVRRLLSTYAGPLYQIRSESSPENTGSGGRTHEVPQTGNGFADSAVVEAACADSVCTVSLLYDQSGNGNDLPVAKAGIMAAGPHAASDDFESIATKGSLKVSGHDVFGLYMEPRQGYRLPDRGTGVPYREAAQSIYLLADGTRSATGCCWAFGNVGLLRTFTEPVSLFYGAERGNRGAGEGPWFMADFGAGIWAGGSEPGDPGYGAGSLTSPVPPSPDNPSMPSSFALGFLKVDTSDYALRMADVTTEARLTTAYRGRLPKHVLLGGSVVLGVSHENANDSWGTFYEGAVVAGFPADDTEEAILENIRAAGYGR